MVLTKAVRERALGVIVVHHFDIVNDLVQQVRLSHSDARKANVINVHNMKMQMVLQRQQIHSNERTYRKLADSGKRVEAD